ncbi:MAG: cytochrome ubiquinol oxidase subunit I [Sinobacteraceae bacterium]|nr:cytochrome ubiquinol oxidase subunit I [Nevskiaceae bacterium]
MWRRTARHRYYRIAGFWTKTFALSVAMAVVSGIPLSYELQRPWPMSQARWTGPCRPESPFDR